MPLRRSSKPCWGTHLVSRVGRDCFTWHLDGDRIVFCGAVSCPEITPEVHDPPPHLLRNRDLGGLVWPGLRGSATTRTMISMDFDAWRRCPDCGAKVWVPLTVDSSARGTAARVAIRETEFREAWGHHVMLNPEKHPTLATASDDDIPGNDTTSAPNG